MQVSTRCRSTVNRCTTEACGSSRTRSHSGRSTVERAGLVEGLPDRQQAAARRRAAARAGRAPRRATGSGSGGASRDQPGGGRGRQHQVALGGLGGGPQQQQRVRRRAGRPCRARPPRRETATPGGDRLELRGGAPGGAGRGAARASTRRQVSRDRWVIRRPMLADVPLGGGRASGRPRQSARCRPSSSGATRSVARPATSCSTSRTSSSGSRQPLQVGVRVRRPARWRPAP